VRSAVYLVETTPGVMGHFAANCERAGLQFRVLPVQNGPLLARRDGEADDGQVAPLLLRLERTAEVLDCSPTTVKRLIKAGDLPAVKVNGATRIRVADLQAYVERLASPATENTGARS
jgi:excisionase family DNA binding protein